MTRTPLATIAFSVLMLAGQITFSQWNYGWRWDKHYDVRALPPHTSLQGMKFSEPIAKNGLISFRDDNGKADVVDLYRDLCSVVLDSAAGKYRFFPKEHPDPNVDLINLDITAQQSRSKYENTPADGRVYTFSASGSGDLFTVQLFKDSMHVRRLDPAGMKPTLLASAWVGGEWPSSRYISPDGKIIAVAVVKQLFVIDPSQKQPPFIIPVSQPFGDDDVKMVSSRNSLYAFITRKDDGVLELYQIDLDSHSLLKRWEYPQWKNGKSYKGTPVFCSSDLKHVVAKENDGKTLSLYSIPDLTFKGAIIGNLYRRECADIDTLESMFDETNYALRAFQKEDIASMQREKFSIIDQTMTGRELTIRSDDVYRLVIFAPDSTECLLSFDEFDNIGNSRTSFLTASGTTFTPGAPAPAGRLVWKNLLARYEVNLASDKGYNAKCRLTVAPRSHRFSNSRLFFNFNKVYSMLIYKKKRDGNDKNLTIKEMPYTEYRLPPPSVFISSSMPAGQEVCPKCNGSRTMVAPGKIACSRCNGRGTVRCSLCDGTRKVYDVYQRVTKGCPQCAVYGAQLCPDCRGERSLPYVDTGAACSECKGTGFVSSKKKQGAKRN